MYKSIHHRSMNDPVCRSSQLATNLSEDFFFEMDVAEEGLHAKGIATQKGRQTRFFTAVNQLICSIHTLHAEVGQP